MRFENRSFSDIFPEGCPPEEANHEKIKVYRMVKDKVLTEEDFKSHVELGLSYRPTKNPPFGEYGVSVNPNSQELINYAKSVPYLRRTFKYIAGGYTYICTGVVCSVGSRNQPSHHNWWLYKQATPHKYFKIEGGEICNGE